MSVASDQYEKDVAAYINSLPGLVASRPSVGVSYSDIKISHYQNIPLEQHIWLEVKMNHKDNLSNPRVFFKEDKWQTSYTSAVALEAVTLLNNSQKAREFVVDISKFSAIPLDEIKLSTTKGGLKEEGAVSLSVMKDYFNQPNVNRYIINEENCDLGMLVTMHYNQGKAEPVYYMQSGDGFYKLSDKNPLCLADEIPILSGYGDFKVRVSTRSKFYEIQTEIKLTEYKLLSDYSLKPETKKLNPFK